MGTTKPLSAIPNGASNIGRIATHGSSAASWKKVVEDAKKKARTLGGDGLVIKSMAHRRQYPPTNPPPTHPDAKERPGARPIQQCELPHEVERSMQ